MKNFVWVLFVIYSISSFAQPINEFNVVLFPQGYGLKLLNSSGNSSIINDVSNISFLNPASINNFENYSAGLSYQANTNIKEAWITDIGMNRVYNFYPQSFGAVANWQGFTFGLGFGQRYNGTKEMGLIPVTTPSQPDGTGEFIDLVEENLIQSYSISSAYSFKELLQSNFDISLGLKYSLNRFHQYVDIWNLEANSTGYYSSFALGLISDFNLDEQRKIQLGVSFESANRFKAEIEYDREPILYDPDSTGNQNTYAIVNSYLLYTSPSELNFDIAVDATENLKFFVGLKTVFWSVFHEYYKDQVEISFSTAYQINEIVKASLGFYSNDFKIESTYYSNLNSELNALFITAGLKININQFSIDLALADSHLLSGKYTQQTIIKLAFGINF
jgi:hypothetical protein